jgi:hypothetical protein
MELISDMCIPLCCPDFRATWHWGGYGSVFIKSFNHILGSSFIGLSLASAAQIGCYSHRLSGKNLPQSTAGLFNEPLRINSAVPDCGYGFCLRYLDVKKYAVFVSKSQSNQGQK